MKPEEAKATVELLAARRLLDSAIADQLSGWLELAKSGARPAQPPDRELERAYELAFQDYKNWIHEWRELARATFERRSYLISLGLARRRSSSVNESELRPAQAEDTSSSAE